MNTFTEQCDMMADIDARQEFLSDWEETFMDSISEWMANGRELTEKQDEALLRIWEKHTNNVTEIRSKS